MIDYSNVINSPIFGGEFSYKTNFTSLTRETAVFDPITTVANTNGLCRRRRPIRWRGRRRNACCAACPAPTRA